MPPKAKITKEMILEAMYKVLQDSQEWSFEAKENEYCNFVDGVLAMTNEMIKNMNEAVESVEE